MSQSQIFSDQVLSMVVCRANYPITGALLHRLFDPYGVEQLVVYPEVIEEGEPCVAADVKFVSGRAAAQAFADWDGCCIYYGCCRLQMWTGSADALPAPSSAAATPTAAAVLHESGDDLAALTASVSFEHSMEPTSILTESQDSVDTTHCVPQAATASADTVEWVLVSAGLAATLAPTPITDESLAVATNGVVSSELVPDSGHGTSLDDGTVSIVPVLVAAAAVDGTLDTIAGVHASCSADGAARVVIAQLTISATTTQPRLWASGSSSSQASPAKSVTNQVISTQLGPNNDDGEHDASLIVAPMPNSKVGVPVMFPTASTTEVGVVLPAVSIGIPWASTKPWMEPVPPDPPDRWSLFRCAWSGARPEASITV